MVNDFDNDNLDLDKQEQRKKVAKLIADSPNKPSVVNQPSFKQTQQQPYQSLKAQSSAPAINLPNSALAPITPIKSSASIQSTQGAVQPSAQMADIAANVGGTGYSTDKEWAGATRRYAELGGNLTYEQARQVLLEHALTSPDRNYATNSILKHLGNAGKKENVMGIANRILGGYRQGELKNELTSEAKKFRADLPEMQAEQSGLLRKEAERTLEGGVRDIRKGYSTRGLLYSGLRQGAESGLKGQVAAEMARQQAGINAELEDLARAREYQAARIGLEGYEEARNRFEELYNKQMQNALSRRRRIANLGGAVGYGVGAYLGGRDTGTNPDDIAMATQGEIYNTTQGEIPLDTLNA